MTPLYVFAFAAAAFAFGHTCINDWEAKEVGRNFGLLVSNYSNTLAESILAPGFTDQTDSVITLIDSAAEPQVPLALGSLTFPSKAAFMALSSQQPSVPFQVVNTWHTCTEVSVPLLTWNPLI
ncbi:hypothetical protein FH972_024282 [Carpinus fangiana]|uniref:NTF2-like domain-containing protein n=1 Tax=Carpinus fangiana TaxID=176857 RepID=A0A5N6KY47_9ROSI|nr:hypothetical protein FH972_024282 [Carpinus fangiana]